MRVDIPFTKEQRKKLSLLLKDPPKDISVRGLIAWIVYQYLWQFKIRECAADRCSEVFLYRPHGFRCSKRYCSNACRVWQSRQQK